MGKVTGRIFEFLDERLGLRQVKAQVFDRKMPPGLGWVYTLGSIALFLFLTQVLTGILLAMNYSPSPDHAYHSIWFIMTSVPMGRLLRGFHKWGASLMVVTVFLHLVRIYFMGAYKYPRELTWIIGLFLLLITLAFGFTGFLLPWDQKAYWATAVGTNVVGQAPLIGPALLKILRGGDEIGAATLSRFYAFHILVLPALLLILTSIHLYVVIRLGISEPPQRGEIPAAPGWKEAVLRRYAEAKARGESFFPFTLVKDGIAIFTVFVLLATLAIWVGADLEPMADPTDTNYNPRPEWYFLFFFQFLKLFPGSLEATAAIIVPTLVFGFLLLLPFLDRGPKRHPFERPLWTTLGIVGLVSLVSLTLAGYYSPRLNPKVSQDPLVFEGRRLFDQLECRYCHSVGGRGGVVGPDLSAVGSLRDETWLKEHFRNPQKTTPGSVMPQLHLLDNEITALVAYMKTLGGGGPFSPRAPHLFQENCLACHALDGKGGDLGPNLSTLQGYRDKGFVYTYIQDPTKLNPNSTMPGFRGELTDMEIEDLSRYLLSPQRGKIRASEFEK